MRRRHFLKLMLPAAALLAGCGKMGASCLKGQGSKAPEDLVQSLKRFADSVLGKQAATLPGLAEDKSLESLDVFCGDDFDRAFRQQAARDFAKGKVVTLEGWIVSRTEAVSHARVYLSGAQPGAGPRP